MMGVVVVGVIIALPPISSICQGSPSLPANAVGSVVIKVRSLPVSHALPVAHTCFLEIDIPNYPKEDIFQDKFKTAIYGTMSFDRV